MPAATPLLPLSCTLPKPPLAKQSPVSEPKVNSRIDSKHNARFDPKQHIEYEPPSNIVMMGDIGYSDDQGISPVAVSQPFKLFSPEAVRCMRKEIFSAEVMENCQFSSNIAACQLRGYSAQYAPFIYDAWHNEETLAILSKIARIDLVPAMDLEIGHINLSVKSDEQVKSELEAIENEKRLYDEDEGIAGCAWEDNKPIVGWHTDGYPFVCVIMLSDCKDMVGGETALRTSTGDILKVRGPTMGCGVILQGRYICHEALRAFGAQERITMVTSFRPRSPMVPDDTVLNTVRPISKLSDLYYEFGEYRLEILEERLRAKLKEIRARRRAGKTFNTQSFKEFLKVQTDFMSHTNGELIPNENVIAGYIEEMDFPDAD